MSDFKLSPINALHNKALASDKMVMLLTQGTPDPEDVAEVGEALRAAGGFVANPDSSVVVSSFGTDSERGEALVAAYAAAKLLTPGGAALSSTNRATVIIPPGKYRLTATLELDTDFVDLCAMIPEKGGDRLATDQDIDGGSGGLNSLASFRPPITLVYTDTPKTIVVAQNCQDIRMCGFAIAILSSSGWISAETFTGIFAFKIGDIDNSESVYDQMYFWSNRTENFFSGPVGCYRHLSGTWSNCISNAIGWTIGKGTWDVDFTTTDALDGEFRAKMTDCQGGSYSFIGDGVEGSEAFTGSANNCRLVRCHAIGKLDESGSGVGSFSGCGTRGAPVLSTCYFEDCSAGDRSYGLAQTTAATYVRCVGGVSSFGGSANSISSGGGVFSGIATDCTAGEASFGGRTPAQDAIASTCFCSGSLTRCTITGNTRALNLTGATLRGVRITNTTTGQHGVQLLDSNSVIDNCSVIVLQGGVGFPVYAASAQNVAAYSCRFNNATNDADGLHSNVTNLVTSAGNVVSNSVT